MNEPAEQNLEQTADQTPAKKRGPGNPNAVKGGQSPNPLGRGAGGAALKAATARAEQAEAAVAELRAKIEDQGVKGEVKQLRVKVAEQAERIDELESKLGTVDAGSDRAIELAARLLKSRAAK